MTALKQMKIDAAMNTLKKNAKGEPRKHFKMLQDAIGDVNNWLKHSNGKGCYVATFNAALKAEGYKLSTEELHAFIDFIESNANDISKYLQVVDY